MWILKRKSDGRKLYFVSGEFTVGRKISASVHIQAPEDVSVSRQHFKIKIVYSASGSIKSGDSTFEVQDLGSTFGTYFSNPENGSPLQKLVKNQWINLKEGSTLMFGKQNEWIIIWNNISILLSAVGNAEKKKLTENVSKIGGRVVSFWTEDVAYLVMEKVMFTQKVFDGLLAEKPIVTVKFFENWINALEKNPESPLPDIAHYIPPLDATLADQFDEKLFLPNEKRKTMFKGKTFIFPQQNSMSVAVEKAGGNAVMDLNFDDVNQEVLLVEWSVSQLSNQSSQLSGNPHAYSARLANIKSLGKRAITLKDISYAILECSTERFCNPSCSTNGSAANMSSSLSQNFSQSYESCLDKPEPPLKKKKVEHFQDILNLEPPSKKVCLEKVNIENVKQENNVKDKQQSSPEPKRKMSVNSNNRPKVLEASQDTVIEPTPIISQGFIIEPTPSIPALKKYRDNEKRNVSKCNTSKWKSSKHSDIPCKITTTRSLVRSKTPSALNVSSRRQDQVIQRVKEMKIVDFKDGKWLI